MPLVRRAARGDRWRWWLALAFALAIARRVLVLSLLFAHGWLGAAFDETLAGRALAARIATPYAVLGLTLSCALFSLLEPHLGVAGAASVIVITSGPMAVAWEKFSAWRGGPRASST